MNTYMKAVLFKNPEYIPTGIWLIPAAWIKYGDELEDIVLKHPALFSNYKKGDYRAWTLKDSYREGEHTDEWGCVWNNIQEGMEAIVTKHPVPSREMVWSLKPPVFNTGKTPHGFMYLRLADLRGFEEIMIDFAEEPADIDEHVHEVVSQLGSPEGGLKLSAECAPDVPLENIEAICCALEKYRFFY